VTKLLPTPEAPEPPPCGPEDYWGGGGRLGNWWPPISEEVNQAIATGGALCLNRVWPFCLGTDPLSGEKILDPQNSHLPGLMFRWTYPDGSSEEWWLAIGFSGTLANGISWETQLGENAGVWNVLLHYCLPPQFLLGLASGTHQATYWLRDIDGNDSNKRWEMIEVE